jgi:hypothetical protein
MTADKFGGRMDDNICPVLNGTKQIRGGKGSIHYQRYAMLMGEFSQGLNINDIGIGVPQGLDEDSLGFGL